MGNLNKTRPRQKKHKITDCGHGAVVNPCAVRLDPFIACQACARMIMLERGGLVMAAVPAESIPAPGETLTLRRVELGDGAFTFVYHAPPTVARAQPAAVAQFAQGASGPNP